MENEVGRNEEVGQPQSFAQANHAASERLLDEQRGDSIKPAGPTYVDKGVCAVGLAAWTWLTVDTLGVASPGLIGMGYICRNEIKSVLGMDKQK